MVLVTPALLFALMLIVQFGLFFHARNVAENAAQEGAAAARSFDGTEAAAQDTTSQYLQALGTQTLKDRSVSVDRSPETSTVKVTGTVTSIIAGMAASADSIDDLQVIRSGGMKRLFDQVYAPATLGQFLREFTHGHSLQLASVARGHLVNLAKRTNLLPGIEQQAYVDIDSLLRPVFGHAKQGASFGHTKIAGKQVLRKGLSPLATTISTEQAAPVLAGIRLRAGRAGSGKGAASMVREAINTARDAGAVGEILVRGDSAYGNSAVVGACLKAKARFSVVLAKNRAFAFKHAPTTALLP